MAAAYLFFQSAMEVAVFLLIYAQETTDTLHLHIECREPPARILSSC